MTNNYVITFTRQFGSLGRQVAQKVSELLDIEYYDRDIVEHAAKKLKLPSSTVTEAEESVRTSLFNMQYPLGLGTTKIQDKVFETQKELINEYVEKENCIVVGRCADYILRDHPRSLHVYLYASYEERVVNCVNALYLTAAEAKKMIKSVDAARASYHKHYAGYLPGAKDHYDIQINTALLGVDGTAELIASLAEKKFGLRR